MEVKLNVLIYYRCSRHFFYFFNELACKLLPRAPVPHYKTSLPPSVYLRKSWTLHIFDGLELPGQFLPALTGQGSLFVLGQFLQSVAVVSQIHLGPDQQEGRPRAVVWNLWHPLWRRPGQKESEECNLGGQALGSSSRSVKQAFAE